MERRPCFPIPLAQRAGRASCCSDPRTNSKFLWLKQKVSHVRTRDAEGFCTDGGGKVKKTAKNFARFLWCFLRRRDCASRARKVNTTMTFATVQLQDTVLQHPGDVHITVPVMSGAARNASALQMQLESNATITCKNMIWTLRKLWHKPQGVHVRGIGGIERRAVDGAEQLPGGKALIEKHRSIIERRGRSLCHVCAKQQKQTTRRRRRFQTRIHEKETTVRNFARRLFVRYRVVCPFIVCLYVVSLPVLCTFTMICFISFLHVAGKAFTSRTLATS